MLTIVFVYLFTLPNASEEPSQDMMQNLHVNLKVSEMIAIGV